MVKIGPEYEEVNQWGVKEEFLDPFQRTEPEKIPKAAGKIIPHLKTEIHFPDILTFHLNFSDIAHAQAIFMGHPDIINAHGIEPHDFRCHRVNGHGVGTGQDQIFFHRDHGSGTRAVAAESTVHHRKYPGVNFFLNGQQIHQGFMDYTVGVMTSSVQESAESVFHAAGGSGVDVALHCGKVNDVLPVKKGWDSDAVRVNPVQNPHFRFGLVGFPFDVPGLKIIQFGDAAFLINGR